jgi:molybdopterin converting factor subunit 1
MSVRVSVRLFASLRDLVGGADRVELDLPEPATPESTWSELVARHPALASRRKSLSAAVNRRYAGFEDVLADGDEIAFIPPVSGG